MPSTDTSSIDEAADALGHSFPRLRLRRGAGRTAFRFQHRESAPGPIAYARMVVSGELIVTGQYPDHIAIGRRHRGSVEIGYREGMIDTAGAYLRPPGESRGRFADSDVELIILERSAFETAARRHLDGTGRRLLVSTVDVSSPVSISAGRLWRSASRAVADSFTRSDSHLPQEVLHELTVATVLSCFALTAEHTPPNGMGYLPRAVQRATAFIDEHVAEPLTVRMIAESARMSVRGIQVAFRRDLGMSPTSYLRRARLLAAHADLIRLDPSATTVAQIAHRWGIEHPARFAQQYRETFGRNPAETLRR